MAEEKTPKKKGSALIYLIIFVVQVLIAGAFFFFVVYPWYMEKIQPIDEKQQAEAEESGEGAEQRPIGPIYKISDLTINPKGSGGKRFAVFEIAVEVINEEVLAVLQQNEPLIKDQVINYFRSKTVQELAVDSTIQKGKMDLTDMMNRVVGGKKVENIYFTRFIIQ